MRNRIIIVRHANKAYANGDRVPFFDAPILANFTPSLPLEARMIVAGAHTVLSSPYERVFDTAASFRHIDDIEIDMDASEFIGNHPKVSIRQGDHSALLGWSATTLLRSGVNEPIPPVTETKKEFKARCKRIAQKAIERSLDGDVAIFTHGFTGRTISFYIKRALGDTTPVSDLPEMGFILQ